MVATVTITSNEGDMLSTSLCLLLRLVSSVASIFFLFSSPPLSSLHSGFSRMCMYILSYEKPCHFPSLTYEFFNTLTMGIDGCHYLCVYCIRLPILLLWRGNTECFASSRTCLRTEFIWPRENGSVVIPVPCQAAHSPHNQAESGAYLKDFILPCFPIRFPN